MAAGQESKSVKPGISYLAAHSPLVGGLDCAKVKIHLSCHRPPFSTPLVGRAREGGLDWASMIIKAFRADSRTGFRLCAAGATLQA